MDNNQFNRPSTPPTPTPLDDFDAGKDFENGPLHPGPLMQQHAPMRPAKRSKKGLWITLVALLVLGLAGYGGYAFMRIQTLESSVDYDSQQIMDLAAENTKLKQDAEDQTQDIPKELTADEQKAADKTAITDVVTAKLQAPTKDEDVKLTVNVMKQNDQFAYVNAGPETGGGAAYILKKVADVWTIIYSGQEKVSAEVVETYTIPAEFQSGQ